MVKPDEGRDRHSDPDVRPTCIALLGLLFLFGCTMSPGGMLPSPQGMEGMVAGVGGSGTDLLAQVSELCSRRIAQLAAPYNPRGVQTSFRDAKLLGSGRVRLLTNVTIMYASGEARTAIVNCIVTGNHVESIDGW